MNRSFFILISLLVLCSTATAVDLYKVMVNSHEDARRLEACGVDAALRLGDGYLVLIDADDLNCIERSGLKYEFVAADVTREQMAIDRRGDDANRGRFPLLFEQDGLRLYRADAVRENKADPTVGLLRPRDKSPKILYSESRPLDLTGLGRAMDLDSLVGLVRQDSLESYANQLETFGPRINGTLGNQLARDWLVSKFTEFGYDSIVLDSFTAEYHDVDTNGCNVIAIKRGSLFIAHEFIIGAHFDSYGPSPGADDNGSGTCAVLEIARVLSGIDTRLTFKFILFDVEELGLHGAYDYADSVAAAGDDILLMLNMDMIAHYENDTLAELYVGGNNSYGAVWQELADSLEGINIHVNLNGPSSSSDQEAFYENGYNVAFLQEHIFSTVYHSAQDSTVYLNFDYHTRMARSCLAAAYGLDAVLEPPLRLVLEHGAGYRPMFYPNRDTTLEVVITAYPGEQLLPGTAELHYSVNDSPFVTVSLTPMGNERYQATIPQQDCLADVKYYFSAEGVYSGLVRYPGYAPFIRVAVATGLHVIFDDDFEDDLGWTVDSDASGGDWVRFDPPYGSWGAPGNDYDGSGYCCVTDSMPGEDVDGGRTTLLSPEIVLGDEPTFFEYARWYSNTEGAAPSTDIFKIHWSPNGGQNWGLIEQVGPVDGADGGWVISRFFVDDLFPSAGSVMLRFDATDYGDDSHIEAAVDAVRVSEYSCAPLIITQGLPDGTISQFYSEQIIAVGGEGFYTWTDQFGDLEGTGLVLEADGLLTGVPVVSGNVDFTARAEDDAADYDEQMLTLFIRAFICGDIDNSGADPDIGDLVYLVDWMFSGGPPPPVMGAADVNNSGGNIDISDLVHLVDYMFTSGPPLECP